jgi:ribosomal protein S18 acetylase RimI-like enzyme
LCAHGLSSWARRRTSLRGGTTKQSPEATGAAKDYSTSMRYSKSSSSQRGTHKLSQHLHYFCLVSNLLHNPVYNALATSDAPLSLGTEKAKFFHEDVSPFAGFEHDYKNGFDDLFQLLPADRNVLYATPTPIDVPNGWKLMVHIAGLQFILASKKSLNKNAIAIVPLDEKHTDEMVELASLTKPGPFNKRTIEFGHYFGIFEDGRLAAMTGQRLHVPGFSEISAVCTHPDYLGKGYAGALLQHQIDLIHTQGQQPFLHVRADNDRAIALYERLGFTVSREMNFYFFKRL